ncbi:MAG: hypothetical protein WKG32_22690 [Gemmatimonadaceae bacterium]
MNAGVGPSPSVIDRLTAITVPVAGAPREVRLRVPTTSQVIPLALEPPYRAEPHISMRLQVELVHVVSTMDGAPLSFADARRLLDDPTALATLLGAREALIDALADRGRVRAECPICRAWEADLSLLWYVLALDAPPWRRYEAGVLAWPPFLSDPRPAGRRPPGVPIASRLSVELPSAAGGLPAVTTSVAFAADPQALSAEHEAEGWGRWAPWGEMPPRERAEWRRGNAGFRAMLRLALALDSLEPAAEPSPESVGAMPVVDFYCLDALYHLAHDLDVPEGGRPLLRCERCAGSFLPVLAAPEPQESSR